MEGRVRRLLLKARSAWLILCTAVLCLLLLEAGLSLAYLAVDRSRASSLDGRSRSDVYADVPWTQEYFRELDQSAVTRWTSYVYWRRQPFQGQYINVDANGIRRTWNAEAKAGGQGDPLKIFTFGGSAMWGVGARDDFTIPSCLARLLEAKGVRCRVTNFGESGYVSTQEVISLLQQLRDGNVPDLVVFYDGVNDIYSAYQQQKAGLPQNEFNRMQEFNVSQAGNYRTLRLLCLRRSAASLATVRFTKNLLRKAGVAIDPPSAAVHPSGREGSHADPEVLYKEVLAVYQGNMRIVRTLGESYGFKTLFYWQPTVFSKGHPTTCESKVRQGIVDLQPYCEKISQFVQQESFAGVQDGLFHDMSGVFSSAKQPIFIDWCHVSEWGNEQVAERMAADVVRLVSADALAGDHASN
ncbi:MAG: SGNH/GDSL hydrolase family protein [Phycisphaerales bacterium]